MEKIYTALGLMSGTSMDGVDVSVIKSDGKEYYEAIFDKYFEYDNEIYQELTDIRDKINTSKDLEIYSDLLRSIERKITLFHAEVTKKVIEDHNFEIDLVGFHGQTIFHNSKEKITKQLGDGNLLSNLLRAKVIYNFRQNDLENNGEGAPLTPIFHQLLINKNNIKLPVCILNIGGIANVTIVTSNKSSDLKSYDIGPGNCLLDEWVRKKTKKKYDINGEIAKIGKTNKILLDQAIDNFNGNNEKKKLSLDIKDFSLNFVRTLSLEDGLSTLTDFTATLISQKIIEISLNKNKSLDILVCGGGRKNLTLFNCLKKKFPNKVVIKSIDDYKINGDFVESQAFAYLGIRSFLKLPISFPQTTNVDFECTGGVLSENY